MKPLGGYASPDPERPVRDRHLQRRSGVKSDDDDSDIIGGPTLQSLLDDLTAAELDVVVLLKSPASEIHRVLVREDVPYPVAGHDQELVVLGESGEPELGLGDQRPGFEAVEVPVSEGAGDAEDAVEVAVVHEGADGLDAGPLSLAARPVVSRHFDRPPAP